jgi:hypothetical protein
MEKKKCPFSECFEIYLITHSFNSQMEFIGLFFFFFSFALLKFIGLAYQEGKNSLFRFITALRDFGP